MWVNKRDVDYEIRKGGSLDKCINYLKMWKIFVIL